MKYRYNIIVAVSGVFDVLHCQHIRLLQFAKSRGDYLIVGINSDNSVKRLKGPTRPINNQNDRAEVLESIKYVDKVVIFEEDDASEFLKEIKAKFWIKGSDWQGKILPEQKIIDEIGTKIIYFDYLDGYSSTNTINKLLLT